MKNRYRKFRRGNVWWCHDSQTGKQSTLKTKSKEWNCSMDEIHRESEYKEITKNERQDCIFNGCNRK